jgi:hypothetical protein
MPLATALGNQMFRNWRRPLPQAILYAKPNPGRLSTLDNARRYIRALPVTVARRPEWKSAAKQLRAAARNGRCEAASRQLELALILYGALDMAPPSIFNNTARAWSEADVLDLENALDHGATPEQAAKFLGRSAQDVTSKADALGLRSAPLTRRMD